MNLRDEWYSALPDLELTVPFSLTSAAEVVFRVGSHSHGTYVPPEDEFGVDDIDLMVICVPPPQFKLGLKDWQHAEYKHGRHDVVFYEWGKWLHMLRKSNPNVLGTLWLHSEDVLDDPHQFQLDAFPAYEMLVRNRARLLSKQMYPAFIGYAKGQLYKMMHHAHQGYMGDKRKQLVERFGYDVKNAAHMIRLLRMACEAFEQGTLTVRRPDAAELIEIKQGRWSLERVVEEANHLFVRAEGALQHTMLPEFPDDLFIQRMMLKGYSNSWGWRSLEWEQ
jgi:uncharacterized protein